MKANIVEIKRFAVHDGDGIRTTVFFKGCPLKCLWCHNPETISPKQQLAFYAHKCIGCGICTTKCEFDAIHLSRDIPAASNMYKSEDKMKAILPYMLKREVKIIFNKDKSKK